MAITFANGQSANSFESATVTISSYDAGSGAKLLVGLGGETSGDKAANSVTHDGNALTLALAAVDGSGGTENLAEIWYADGLSGTGDIVATYDDGPTNTERSMVAIRMSGAASGGPTDTASNGDIIATITVTTNLSQTDMTVVSMFSYALAENITTSETGQNEIVDDTATSTGQMMSEKGETSSGNSDSGATGSLARRFVGVSAGFEEAAAAGQRPQLMMLGVS